MKREVILFAFAAFLISRFASAHNESTYLLSLPTTQTTGKRIVLFDVGHRYLDVNRHTTNVNILFGYGVTDWADIYAAYSFKNKDSVASGKVNILNDIDEGGSLLAMSLSAGFGYKDVNEINNTVSMSYFDSTRVKSRYKLKKGDRMSYYVQPVAEKHLFSNRFSLGLVPTFAYNTNFYGLKSSKKYTVSCGVDAAFYFGDRFAVSGELVPKVYGFGFRYMTFNAGLKYTGFRHTFALWVGNSSGYSPVEYAAGSAVLDPKICASFTREFDI
jgi:hypothetical protein